MSEYIEIETELSDDGAELYVSTNLNLSETVEIYASAAAMEEGSPIAQALAVIGGIAELEIDGRELTIILTADAAVHAIASDIHAALTDFFL